MHTHKELIAWQRAHAVAIGAHRFAQQFWRPEYAAVFDQLRRASLSAQLNVAEAYASGRTPRCKLLLRVAYGSAVETTDLLEFLIELGAVTSGELQHLAHVSRETQALTLLLLKRSNTR
jgi:four helix bundle protein